MVLCGAAVAAALVLSGQRLGARAEATQARSEENAKTIAHLCVLEHTTAAVFRAAAASYASLPDPTVGQLALLAELRRGVAEISSDNSCDTLLEKESIP